MNKLINETQVFTNPNTHTMTIAYPKWVDSQEKHSLFAPEEIEESDGYVVAYPYGHKEAPIVATINDGNICITFERDCYVFGMPLVHLVGAMAEIWFDTEDIDLIREYLKSYQGQIK